MGSASNAGLLSAVYEAVSRVARTQPQLVPTQLVMSDQRLLRVVPMRFCPGMDKATGAKLQQGVADNARTIRDRDEDKNRWSGSGRGKAPDQGGLYLSLDSGALGAEISHYNHWLPRNGAGRAPDVPQAFAAGAVTQYALFRMRPMVGLLVVDFSKHSPGRQRFFAEVDRDAKVRGALRTAGGAKTCEDACRGDDYSCSRGVALGLAAASGPAYDGILVRTARDNPAIRDDGNNLVLFGPNLTPHAKLTVECAVAPVAQPNGKMTLRLIGY